MLCYIENASKEVSVKEGDVFLFTPPQSERETIDQIIKVVDLIQSMNPNDLVPLEERVVKWMSPGLSLEEATISMEVKDHMPVTEVKNTAFIASWKEIPDSRFTLNKPSANSRIGSDTITTNSALSTLEVLEARARSLADRLLDGRILAGHYRDSNEAVVTLPKNKDHRVGLRQLDVVVRLMASQLDEVLCEIKDFVYQGTFASRKQSFTLSNCVAKAAKRAGVGGLIRSYDVKSVDIQFPDRSSSISFTKALDDVSCGSLKIVALTRCVLRVESLTAAEAMKLFEKEEEVAK
jgi:hypothetical protein